MSHWVALMSSSPFEIWLLGSIQKGAPNPKTKQINWFYLLLLFPPFTFFPSQENIPSFNAQFCPSTPPFSLWPTCLARSSMVGLDPNSKENKSESPSHPIPPPPPNRSILSSNYIHRLPAIGLFFCAEWKRNENSGLVDHRLSNTMIVSSMTDQSMSHVRQSHKLRPRAQLYIQIDTHDYTH